MGFRFRRRISFGRGLRVNLGKRGASLSMGTRGAWFTLGSHGARATVGIPGTGISWTGTSKSKRVQQAPANVQMPIGNVITEPPDQADTVGHALQSQGYEVTQQNPQAKAITDWFVRICIFAFAFSFGIVLALRH
jgi:Protein of unknown function (DUF4236)